MTWKALTALAALANTTIALVAAVAAVLQIRHCDWETSCSRTCRS